MKAFLLFFVLISYFFLEAYPQEEKITFEQLSLKEGLSQNNVLCMLQDRKGYVWFETYEGLNRYDGYTFKVFNFDYQDTSSLSQNLVISLFEDSRGILWIGTAGNSLTQFSFRFEPWLINVRACLPRSTTVSFSGSYLGC